MTRPELIAGLAKDTAYLKIADVEPMVNAIFGEMTDCRTMSPKIYKSDEVMAKRHSL